jgi:hypothetical protein
MTHLGLHLPKDFKRPCLLVQDAKEDLVEDHLAQPVCQLG